MGYYWLNQRREQKSAYSDLEGEVYHYRSNVPGCNHFSEGDWFVYYRPGEHVLFGAGRVSEVEVVGGSERDTNPDDSGGSATGANTGSLTNYLAHMEHYRPFDPPVSAREIKGDISFLRGRNGLSGVPQHSIYGIGREDYMTILMAAGEADLLEE